MDKKRNNTNSFNYKLLKINNPNEYIEDEKKYIDALLNKSNQQKEQKEKIQSEIYKLINKNMENIEKKIKKVNTNTDGTLNINTSRSLDPNFQNYSGERISVITYPNSNTQTIEKENTNNNDSFHNNNNEDKNKNGNINLNTDSKMDMKLKTNFDKINQIKKTEININNINNSIGMETTTEKETIFNSSNFSIINKNLDKDNSEEEKEIVLSERKSECKIKNIFISENNHRTPNKHNKSLNENNSKNKIYFKDKNRSLSPNYSLFDSTSTSNTYEKNRNKFKFHKIIDDTCNTNIYLKYNKTELINFFSEINLPSIYAHKFIENGFDDLNVILSLTKTGIAITNQNLKDIGIMNAGHRAQILIHLEERAEIFPFYLEKNIIYNNKYNKNNNSFYYFINDNSLFKFLNRIGCQKYINNFRRNGYYNCELLFSQMLTREPITKEMLYKDFSIDNEESINKIIKSLNVESKNYLKGLRRNNTNVKVIFDDKKYQNSCQPCLIF